MDHRAYSISRIKTHCTSIHVSGTCSDWEAGVRKAATVGTWRLAGVCACVCMLAGVCMSVRPHACITCMCIEKLGKNMQPDTRRSRPRYSRAQGQSENNNGVTHIAGTAAGRRRQRGTGGSTQVCIRIYTCTQRERETHIDPPLPSPPNTHTKTRTTVPKSRTCTPLCWSQDLGLGMKILHKVIQSMHACLYETISCVHISSHKLWS